jgi:multidrug efflux pump subunit AcrA (membrane-fusion protein)
MKILKMIGALIVLAGVFAIGYWRGQSDPKANRDSAASDHSAGETAGGSQSMAGHDMGSAGVNISPERQQLMGIRTATAEIRPMVQKIRTVGIVTYDETRLAQVFSKVEGWIEELLVNYTGTLVRKGQPLFTLYSPDLVATQEEYLLALKA